MPNSLYVRTNSLLKIRFPSLLTHNHWAIEEKQTKAMYALPLEGIIMAIICIKAITKTHLFKQILCICSTPKNQLESILAYLIDKQIIFCIANPHEVDKHFIVAKNWESAGWDMAAHYHIFTCDTPYLDYSEKGNAFEKVRNKMLEYHLVEPDVERCKAYATNLGTQQLPSMENILHSYGFSTKA